MKLKVLTLNCGKGYVAGLYDFLEKTLQKNEYDFVLLQEFSSSNAEWFKSNIENYKILRVFDKEINMESELAIVYRKDFILKESQLYLFNHFLKANLKRPEFGFLLGKFKIPQSELIIGSIHSSAVLYFNARSREAKFAKKCLLDFNPDSLPIIFGGDFNSGLPGEKTRNNKIFRPDFINLTINSGVTVNSRYVEPRPGWWLNVISVFFAKFGLGICMDVDHIFVDKKTAKTHASSCKVFPDRISDHSAMEVSLSTVKN